MTYYGKHTVYCKRTAPGCYFCNDGYDIVKLGKKWVIYNSFGSVVDFFDTLHEAIQYLMDR